MKLCKDSTQDSEKQSFLEEARMMKLLSSPAHDNVKLKIIM